MSRWGEIPLAVVLLAVLLPVMAVVAIAVLLLEGRPVIFASERVGAGGRRFRIYKFRSMTVARRSGVTGGHCRSEITPTGRVLRRSRLDELPQIVNLLRGDLSFVGPRPPAPDHALREPAIMRNLLDQRPGITGLATLVFHRHEEAILATGQTREEVEALYLRRCARRKARIDRLYRRRRSALLDLWLMALTAKRMMGGCGRRLPRFRGAAAAREPAAASAAYVVRTHAL